MPDRYSYIVSTCKRLFWTGIEGKPKDRSIKKTEGTLDKKGESLY